MTTPQFVLAAMILGILYSYRTAIALSCQYQLERVPVRVPSRQK
ncbi:hypothetical protein [Laspinema sp. D2d]|nr:hypothetical protein [Laspinema sp. D2d]